MVVVPVPPAAENEGVGVPRVLGQTEPPDCMKVSVWPATVTEPVRVAEPVLAAMLMSTLPEPVALALSRIVAQDTFETAVQGQVATFVSTLTSSAMRPGPSASMVSPSRKEKMA